MIIWDGASYHRCKEVHDYLSEANQDLDEKNWKVTCLLFAPNAPDQMCIRDSPQSGRLNGPYRSV